VRARKVRWLRMPGDLWVRRFGAQGCYVTVNVQKTEEGWVMYCPELRIPTTPLKAPVEVSAKHEATDKARAGIAKQIRSLTHVLESMTRAMEW
jgi:hypothetical protein